MLYGLCGGIDDYKKDFSEMSDGMRCIKLLLDKLLAVIALLVLSPVFAGAAIGIKPSSKEPIFYKAQRIGKNMVPYVMYKFRTMRVDADKEGTITAVKDSSVCFVGKYSENNKN